MKFLTCSESNEIIKSLDATIDPKNHETLAKVGYTHICLKYPPCDSINHLAYQIAFSNHQSPWVLGLFTDWSIFSDYENTYLYYLIRKQYYNFSHIEDSPGHLFLNHEGNELFSIIEIAILNSYDLLIISNYDYSRYKLSHDGFLDVYTNDSELIEAYSKYKNARHV